MKYDKDAILNTARKLQRKSSGLSDIQWKLSRITPNKCNSNFYIKRSSLARRINNVQNEINLLSKDISNAANEMSADDVQNARMIREVLKNRAEKMTFGQSAFSVQNVGFNKNGVFGSTLSFSKMELNQCPVSSLGNATSGKVPWYKKVGNFFTKAGKWSAERLNDVKDWGKAKVDYTWKSVKQFVLGEYSGEDMTMLSFAGNIAAGFFGVDIPLDNRDLVYDVQHWGEGDNFGFYFALDVIALIPAIGVLKNLKYAGDVADGAKDLGNIMGTVSDVGKAAEDIGKASKNVLKFSNWEDMKDAFKGMIGQFLKENKPKYSPAIIKWFDMGGSIEIKYLDGKQIWTYISSVGEAVSYIDGYIQFPDKYLHPIIKSINIGEFTGDRAKDIDIMLSMLKEYYGITGIKQINEILEDYVVHHDIINGVLQLVKKDIHEKFTHLGGHSIYK